MVLRALGPVTRHSLPVAGPGWDTTLPSLCWGRAEGGTGLPTREQEQSVLSSRKDGGADPGLSAAAPAARASCAAHQHWKPDPTAVNRPAGAGWSVAGLGQVVL